MFYYFKYKSRASYIKRLHLLSFFIASIVFCNACKAKHNTPADVTITPSASVANTKDLTEEAVVDLAKKQLSQTNKTVSIQVHYWASELTKVPCTQYDVDAGVACSQEVAGAPYGYKNVSRNVQKCCREKNIPLYNTVGNWSADYSYEEDKWTVTYEFNAENLKYHFVWLIDDNNSQITEKGLKQ